MYPTSFLKLSLSELDFSANSTAPPKEIMYKTLLVSRYNAVIRQIFFLQIILVIKDQTTHHQVHRKLSEKLLWNKGTFQPCQPSCPRTHLLSRKFRPHFKCRSLFSGEHGNFVGTKKTLVIWCEFLQSGDLSLPFNFHNLMHSFQTKVLTF